jgi:predicted nucleotidyltransferase
MTTIDVTLDDLRVIRNVLQIRGWLPYAYVFGLRVTGKALQYSDLDMVIHAPKPLPTNQLQDIKDIFAESDIPFLILDLHSV